jgi:hypothetical protein
MASTVDRCREALSSTDEVRLVELAADRSEWVRASVPLNPAAPRELLRACLSDRSWRVVAAVAGAMASDAQSWNDAEVLPDEAARWLASCGALTEEAALRLARHENVSVRESLASSTPWLSAQAQLAQDRVRQVRIGLAGSRFLLPAVRRVLVADPDDDVRDLAVQRWTGAVGSTTTADSLGVTEDDLMAEALRQQGNGAAAAVQYAATQEHDRATDATRQRIMSTQVSLPWPAPPGSVVDVPDMHDVAIRTDVAGRPPWLAEADGLIEQIAVVLAGLGGVLEGHHELDGDLVLTASVPTSLTSPQIASAVAASTNVSFTAQPGA